MALMKFQRGFETNLPSAITDGVVYFCKDTGNWYIDHLNASGNPTRSKISAKYADKLRYKNGDTTIEIDPAVILTSSNYATKIGSATTSKAGLMSSADKTKLDGISANAGREAYLQWGGKNFSGSYGPIDAAMVPELGANRLAFMPANGVTVEYSTNGGSTWSIYSTSDAAKIDLFNGNGTSYYIGASTAKGIDKSGYMLRVTIETDTACVYTALNKFVIYCSTNGSSGSYCTITARKQADYSAGTDTWTTFANNVPISGWSGYNIINTSSFQTHGNTDAQYRQVRFTFGVTSHASTVNSAGLSISKIMGFGGVGWTTPSNMAKNGRMYTYDSSQNVTFPAKVTATSFTGNLTGTASKATADANGNSITSTYATKSVATASANGLMSSTDKSKLDGIASGANNYSLPTASSSTLGGVKVGTNLSISNGVLSATDTKYSVATTSANGLMSSADKTKLDGIATGANAYTHPSYTARTGKPTANATPGFGSTFTVSQITSDGTGHVTGATDRTVTIPNSAATTSAAGLMSAADKSKLDGITSSADAVSFSANATSGNKVGTITINGTATDMYSPTQTTVSGNAGSATKLATARTIDGILFNGSANIAHYGTCSTAAATTEKAVSLTGFTLATGARVVVKFTVTNTASSPTLNVNSTGAKAIYYKGAAISASYLKANYVYEFVYNGTQYDIIGQIDTNTTYSTATSSANGLMSSTDKSKLDGIATGANAYTHPSYTARTGVPSADQAPAFGGTFTVSQPTSDATGHITAINSRTITIPNATATTSAAGLMSSTDKSKLDGISSGAEVNQNAFSKITVGSTNIEADSKTDTLTIVAGSNITLTPDATNDKLTIAAKDTTYSTATTSAAGLMSASDKSKLDGIASGATATSIQIVRW